MSKIHDLEQSILECTRVVDDLKIIASNADCGSDFTNVLHGIAELYHYKLEKLWEDFEGTTKQYYEYRDRWLAKDKE